MRLPWELSLFLVETPESVYGRELFVVQLFSPVLLFATPRTEAGQASLPFTIS